MVGVQLSGGLGNQMFEYALYLKLKSMGKDVRIDDVTCYGAQEKQRVNQLSVFGVSYERMTKQEYEQITDSSMSPSIVPGGCCAAGRICPTGSVVQLRSGDTGASQACCWDIFRRNGILPISKIRCGKHSHSEILL
ncbi:MAG: hypothetical protein ACLURV_00045 [Gallintestinimicrobium sp.]